jgi:hypothetical protein
MKMGKMSFFYSHACILQYKWLRIIKRVLFGVSWVCHIHTHIYKYTHESEKIQKLGNDRFFFILCSVSGRLCTSPEYTNSIERKNKWKKKRTEWVAHFKSTPEQCCEGEKNRTHSAEQRERRKTIKFINNNTVEEWVSERERKVSWSDVTHQRRRSYIGHDRGAQWCWKTFSFTEEKNTDHQFTYWLSVSTANH